MYYVLVDNTAKLIYLMQEGANKKKAQDFFYLDTEAELKPNFELLAKDHLPFLNG